MEWTGLKIYVERKSKLRTFAVIYCEFHDTYSSTPAYCPLYALYKGPFGGVRVTFFFVFIGD